MENGVPGAGQREEGVGYYFIKKGFCVENMQKFFLLYSIFPSFPPSNKCKITSVDEFRKEINQVELLVKKAQRGDAEAFITLIEQNKQSMYKVARGFLKEEEDVADAMQDIRFWTVMKKSAP